MPHLLQLVFVAICVAWLRQPVQGAPIPSTGAVALPADVADTINMLANASFEEGSDFCPVDWVFANQCEKTEGHWISGAARSGIQSVSVEGAGGLAFGRWMTAYRLPLVARGQYRLSFWYKGRGGSVYLMGNECHFDAGTGVLTETLSHAYQTPVVKTVPSSDWRFYEARFTSPDYPSWARVCLAGGGRDTCFFDDVSIVPAGLHLIQPRAPILCETGSVVTIEVRLENGEETTSASWEVSTPGLSLVRATFDSIRMTWRLDLRIDRVGSMALGLRCRAGLNTYALDRLGFVRAHPPLRGTFAFAVFTDAHLYRPGVNERNVLFGKFVAVVNALDPLFTLGLGDQMEISSGAGDTQKKWIAEAVREQIGRLHGPVYSVSGNHEVDKTVEGAGTRWYQEKYLDRPAFSGFAAGGFFFAGIDTTVAGVYGRDHGGGLVHAGQTEWLDDALRKAREGGLFPVIWCHMPLFGEFPAGPDRDRLLALIYSNHVRLVLSGHIHNNEVIATYNPVLSGRTMYPLPKPEALADGAAAVARLANPASTVFMTTTTVSAFLLGGCPYNAFLYAWVRDGRIAWIDTIPLSLSVVVEKRSEYERRIHIRNGPEKALTGLPLKLDMTEGLVSASVNGRAIPVWAPAEESTGYRWIQVDIPAGGEMTVEVCGQPQL